MTNTQDYDDHSWLDGSTLDSAAGPLSGEAKRTLEAETLERERDAASGHAAQFSLVPDYSTRVTGGGIQVPSIPPAPRSMGSRCGT
jgi:hypothetical protein